MWSTSKVLLNSHFLFKEVWNMLKKVLCSLLILITLIPFFCFATVTAYADDVAYDYVTNAVQDYINIISADGKDKYWNAGLEPNAVKTATDAKEYTKCLTYTPCSSERNNHYHTSGCTGNLLQMGNIMLVQLQGREV